MTGFVVEGRRMDGGVHDSVAIVIGRDDRKADALFSSTNKAMRMKTTTTKRSGACRRVDRRSSDDDDGRLMKENFCGL
jgi:glucose-6-phosphate dehydrogenase assembly protein OpcA